MSIISKSLKKNLFHITDECMMGYLFALLTAISTGLYVTLSKLALNFLSPLDFICFVMVLSVLFLLPFLPFESKIRPISRKALFFLLLHSGCAVFGTWAFWTGLKEMNPAAASFINRTETLVTILLAVVILKERLSWWLLIATAVVVCGLTVMSLPSLGSFQKPQAGFWLVVASSFGWGMAEVFSKIAIQYFTPLRFTFWRNVLVTIPFVVVAMARSSVPMPEGNVLAIVAAASFLGPVMARMFYMQALKRMDVSLASIFGQTQPIFTAFFALLILHSWPRPNEWVGGFLIVFGCTLLVSWRNHSM
ncbi:MAG: DMT family transporter [Deltaproteobacteria bacterium]|nr:DMT family transporter [Deltaproteobacteria bacterium]